MLEFSEIVVKGGDGGSSNDDDDDDDGGGGCDDDDDMEFHSAVLKLQISSSSTPEYTVSCPRSVLLFIVTSIKNSYPCNRPWRPIGS
jgi:hypothetical protein